MTPGAAMDQLDPDAAARLADQGAMLLDVREDGEWDAGHAPGAVHMAMSTLATRLAEVPEDRAIVCVCRSGARSMQVARALETRGRTAHNLAGGMQAWAASGREVVRDGGEPGFVA